MRAIRRILTAATPGTNRELARNLVLEAVDQLYEALEIDTKITETEKNETKSSRH